MDGDHEITPDRRRAFPVRIAVLVHELALALDQKVAELVESGRVDLFTGQGPEPRVRMDTQAIPGAVERDVVAEHHVAARAAVQHIVERAADNDVIAVLTEQDIGAARYQLPVRSTGRRFWSEEHLSG